MLTNPGRGAASVDQHKAIDKKPQRGAALPLKSATSALPSLPQTSSVQSLRSSGTLYKLHASVGYRGDVPEALGATGRIVVVGKAYEKPTCSPVTEGALDGSKIEP